MKKQLMSAIFLALAVVASGCAATRTEGASAKSETTGEYLDDATTTASVHAMIVGDADAHLFQIEVSTTQGEVLLRGRVNSRDTEGRLVAKIKAMKGVRSVKSVLRLDTKETS